MGEGSYGEEGSELGSEEETEGEGEDDDGDEEEEESEEEEKKAVAPDKKPFFLLKRLGRQIFRCG